MHTDLPKTINEALKILAYNDYFWIDSSKLGSRSKSNLIQRILKL